MDTNVQVSNDSETRGIESLQSPESADFDSSDFFEALDSNVNGGILERNSDINLQTSEEQPTSSQDMIDKSPVEDNDTDVENLQKRYSDSSREAKKLNAKLSEIEPYMPILDAMREDPNLITHVRNYFEGGGQAPVSMKEQLELGEDFIFDPDEAMSNPDSDSSQLLNATIDGIVQKRLNTTLLAQRNENQRLTRESEFRQRHEMGDEEWSTFVKFAKDKSLQLDDIYFLMNRGKREQNIAKNANEQVSQQMKRAKQKPQSLATAGSQEQQESSPEDKVFDRILGIDAKLDEAFGI